ncbi:aromatic acid exporter family protein [Terrisporobacter petrolearius]|uniref:aromatic acid exporter family protein n=1 Tax=Terrisporobacter petrolearius TaxID=1460447 RepID=UPI0031CCC949
MQLQNIIGMRTIKTSFKMGTQRVLGTLIGGLIGFLLVLISPANPILCGIGIMLVIKCCNMFKLSSLVVSSVTFLSLYLGYVDRAPLVYYKRLKKLYKNEQILLQVNEDESPVFNFHLNKVIEKTNLLEELIGPNY